MATTVDTYDADRLERNAELKALGFDPKNAAHRAAVRLADRWGLDPLAHELIVIPGKGAYVTRDGLLALAHRSGKLDGIVVEDESDTDTHWTARVSVYRNDMSHPFTFRGRYADSGPNKLYGPEMAVTRAESMALRRAFRVTGLAVAEEMDLRSEPAPDADYVELDEADAADAGLGRGSEGLGRVSAAYPPLHWRMVAEVYEEAVSEGGSLTRTAPTRAVAVTWNVPFNTAASWVHRARALGYLAPSEVSQGLAWLRAVTGSDA